MLYPNSTFLLFSILQYAALQYSCFVLFAGMFKPLREKEAVFLVTSFFDNGLWPKIIVQSL
jgi:hypothetical protein